METSIVFSFVAKLKTSPIDFVHKIPCGAPQSLEFPCGELLFFVFYFVLGLHKVPKVSTQPHKLVNTGKRGPPIVPLLFIHFRNTSRMFCARLANGGLFPTGDPIVPFVISPRFECLNKLTHTTKARQRKQIQVDS